MTPDVSPRFAQWSQWAFSLFPAAALACFYSFVVRARFTLGHWPTYNHPDPKQLGFDVHHSLVSLLVGSLPITAVVAVMAAVTARYVPRQQPLWRALWPVVVSFGIAFAVIITDPGGFFGWYAD